MTPLPQTISEVLAELDTIIDASIKAGDYLGIFAFVYRRTTAQIQTEILRGSFEDNARMERFDVVFANRYLAAYRQYTSGHPPTACWRVAFDARLDPLTILQHLVMGMNAHISFDLAIAAADFQPADQIQELKADFMKINQILANLVDEMQQRVARVSGALFLLDWIGGRNDEKVINFGIRSARQIAWTIAQQVVVLEGEARQTKIDRVDQDIARLNQFVRHPEGWLLRNTLRIIRWLEEKDIEKIINCLREEPKA